MPATTDEITETLHGVLNSFVAVCGAPDDAEVARQADDTLAQLDSLLTAATDD
jgi:hypothetical protein